MNYYTLALQYSKEAHQQQGWSTLAQQEVRFWIMLEAIQTLPKPSQPFQILDFGCGQGDFLSFLEKNASFDFEYHGLDAMPAMIKVAQKKHPSALFETGSWQNLSKKYDIIVGSGVFNVREFWQKGEVDLCLQKLYHYSRQALLFNMLQMDGTASSLQGFSPQKVQEKFKNMGAHVQLIDDYFPQDFTLLIQHEKSPTPAS